MSVPGKLLEDRASPLASFQFSQLWAATMVGVTSSYLFKQDCARHLKLGAVLCLLVAVLAFKAASKERYRPAVGIQAVCYFAFVYIKHGARCSSSQATKGGSLKEVPEAPKVKQLLPGRPAKEELENQQKEQQQLVEGSGHDEGEQSELSGPSICDSAADLCQGPPNSKAEATKEGAGAPVNVGNLESDSQSSSCSLLHMERRLHMAKEQLRGSSGTEGGRAYAPKQQQLLAKQEGGFTAPGSLRSIESQKVLTKPEPANPALHKAMSDAMKARAATGKPSYSSLVYRPSRTHANSIRDCVRKSCRLAVKITGPSLPGHVPVEALQQLQSRLQRFQKLTNGESGESPAVRAGCIVISFGSMDCTQGPFDAGSATQNLREGTAATVEEWALEHGLVTPEQGLLFVQACQHSTWGSPPQEQPSAPKFSMALQAPFLVTSLPQAVHERGQQQAQIERDQEQWASCRFELTIIALPQFDQLRGWQGAADAPEELPDEVKSRSLSLLANVDGQFLPISVEQRSMASDGERVTKACVSLPEAGVCSRVLVLELWAAGSLVCSSSTVLLPSSYSGALAELESMQQEEAEPVFVHDLVHWAHFQAYSRSAMGQQQQWRRRRQQQQQQQQQEQETSDLRAAEGVHEQQLALMADVGKALFAHSLACGLADVSGLLLEGLTHFPFCLSASSLLGDEVLGTDQQATLPNKCLHQVERSTSLPVPVGKTQQEPPAVATAVSATATSATAISALQIAAATATSEAQRGPTLGLAHSDLDELRNLADGFPVLHPPLEQNGAAGKPAGVPSWAAAACACIQGFGAGGNSCRRVGNHQQQQQQQQQHEEQEQLQPALKTQLSEAGFREWCAVFTKPLLSLRYYFCVIWALSALLQAFTSEMALNTRGLIVANTLPYLLSWQPKVALQAGKWAHIICWIVMSATSFFPPECFTRNIMEMNIDVIIISLFLSQSFDKVNAKALLCERVMTTVVFALVYNGLNAWCPLTRSLLVNAAAAGVELAFDIHLRYLYMRHHNQRLRCQKKMCE